MAITNLVWQDLEELLVNTIDSEYEKLDEQAKRQYCLDLKVAHEEMKKLASSNGSTATYGLPRIGEAYALWHHMTRTENVCQSMWYVAKELNSGHKKYNLGTRMRILDVGSGTSTTVVEAAFSVLASCSDKIWQGSGEPVARVTKANNASVSSAEQATSVRVNDGFPARSEAA